MLSIASFTLAEVLITLTIIGVIAALTIPNLMRDMQEHAWHQQWKDNYALINNAFKMAIAENPDIKVSEGSLGNSLEFVDLLSSKLNVVDYCYIELNNSTENAKLNAKIAGSQWTCDSYDSYIKQGISKHKWSGIVSNYSAYKTLAGGSVYSYDFKAKALLLKTGTVVYIGGSHSGGTILVDVNGKFKGPNVIGKDVYGISVMKAGEKYSGLTSVNTVAGELVLVPYGPIHRYSNSSDSGTSGCASNIGKQGGVNYLYTAPGIGCSYKYLYEK